MSTGSAGKDLQLLMPICLPLCAADNRGETESGRVWRIAAFMQRMAERPEVQDALSAEG